MSLMKWIVLFLDWILSSKLGNDPRKPTTKTTWVTGYPSFTSFPILSFCNFTCLIEFPYHSWIFWLNHIKCLYHVQNFSLCSATWEFGLTLPALMHFLTWIPVSPTYCSLRDLLSSKFRYQTQLSFLDSLKSKCMSNSPVHCHNIHTWLLFLDSLIPVEFDIVFLCSNPNYWLL